MIQKRRRASSVVGLRSNGGMGAGGRAGLKRR